RSPLGFCLLQVLRLLAVRAPSRPFRSWPFATPTEVSIAWVFSVFSAWEPNRSLSRPADLPEVSCLPGCPDEASAPSLRSLRPPTVWCQSDSAATVPTVLACAFSRLARDYVDLSLWTTLCAFL